MIRLCIVCEGQTEVEFIMRCIRPHLYQFNVQAYPCILRARSGRHRGGRVTVERLADFIANEYSNTDRLTTLVDFYGFQDRNGRSQSQLQEAIMDTLRQKKIRSFRPERVFPYVQMHEFEALLFSDVAHFDGKIEGWNPQLQDRLQQVTDAFCTPEEINDGPQTAPSKRLLTALPLGSYNKTVHGPLIAESIGLPVIRQRCPRFDQWMTMLEQCGQ